LLTGFPAVTTRCYQGEAGQNRERRYSANVEQRTKNTKWSAAGSKEVGTASQLAEMAAEEADAEMREDGVGRNVDGSAPAGFFKLQRDPVRYFSRLLTSPTSCSANLGPRTALH
jgi:hypothetical protein